MNEDQLKAILARNKWIRVEETENSYVFSNRREVPTPEPERGAPDALDEMVPREETSQARPIVRFIFYRTRLLDCDARAHGCKDLLDGLVEAGILPGDREDQIDFDARQKKVHYKKDERTEIEITLP